MGRSATVAQLQAPSRKLQAKAKGRGLLACGLWLAACR
ncbi:hypothetical protein C4K39_0162 [Pseudomonas sessilinigenes]|nr:hypothetical protein C4K39_0162 [Pseudomonas sessilinigenes]